MNETPDRIPFAVDVSRMIEILAAQIYPTTFALLRENVQNSFDAILLRKHFGQEFSPRIDITVEPRHISVSDNGIGMSRQDLRDHFWRAGSTSKNTDEARAAGVVGTFGIGAMANFGIAEELHVLTESLFSGERTECSADRSTLSVTDDCISFNQLASKGRPGTRVAATMQPNKPIRVSQAISYISQFVAFLPIDVYANGKRISRNAIDDTIPKLGKETWSVNEDNVTLGGRVTADILLTGAANGDVRIALSNIKVDFTNLAGRMLLHQGVSTLRTFRSGFGLATTSINSFYNFGGIADFLFLQPTAGREALTTASMQLLQRIVSQVDEFVSLRLASRHESNGNSAFVSWAARRSRYDLCSHLRVSMRPGDTISLYELKRQSQEVPLLVYFGTDQATIEHASEDRPVVITSRSSSRRKCEIGYLRHYCRIEELSKDPQMLGEKAAIENTTAEKALAFRIASILNSDYFLAANIKFGKISHNLPVLVTKREKPTEIFLDPDGGTVQIIFGLYENQYPAFTHMVKDFVRNMIFPRVSDLVPTATRQGAEAFLKSIHRSREIFEVEFSDLESLTTLWKDYMSGRLSFQQATERSKRVATRSYQFVDSTAAGSMREIVPDVIENQSATAVQNGGDYSPMPPIQRLDMTTEKKVLTIDEDEGALKNYRCFLAVTDRIHEKHGDFFLQPHRTSVVWGGQRALFIFQHHSGEFGLYYDLQTRSLVSGESGGGPIVSCSIVMKNRVFIPIPAAIQESFLPAEGERIRFEVRCDILHIDRQVGEGM